MFSRSRRRQRRGSAGFTLIEILVAMAILAVLMTVVYSGLSVALTMWGSAGRRAEAFEEMQSSLDVLRNQIRGALPLIYVPDPLQIPAPQRMAFSGTPDVVSFVSGTSWRDGAQAVPRWVELKVDAGRLKIEERAILPPSNGRSASLLWHSEVSGFEDVHFRYLRRALPDRGPEWRDAWDPSELRELPRAIGLRYTLKGRVENLTIPLDYAEASMKGYQVQ